MEWSSQGYILSVRKHGETSAIIDVLTPDRGRHLGLVRGGVSRKARPVLQPGNKVKVTWRGRLSEHLGSFTVEPLSARAAEIMEDRLSLAGLNSICAIARECLPEREAHPEVYQAFEVLLANLHDPDIWPALYVRWEAGLLTAMGYGMDLQSCAATGVNDNEDVKAGMALTGYFLETRVQWGVNKTLPAARTRMLERLSAEGYSL